MLSQWIRIGAYHFGHCVAAHPSLFVFIPLLLFVGLLHSTVDAVRSSLSPGSTSQNEELFLPDNGRIRETKEKLSRYFPDGGHFSTRSWLAPNLRIVILQAEREHTNVLDPNMMELYAELRSTLERTEIATSRGRVSLASLCEVKKAENNYKPRHCKRDPLSLVGLLGELQYPFVNISLGPLDPISSSLYRRVNLAPYLGGVRTDSEGNVKRARLARMVIDLPRVEWIEDK
ncbi:hypothetical protein PFISCL1PPCAC_11141, partial [Pristionchus fissidentatus]